MKGPKITVLGGGTGLAALLRGLKNYSEDIWAVVCMTDDGRSSGKLRKDLKMLPPGDIRQCLAALSSQESLLLELFNFRFNKGKHLSGHSLGNLLLAALTDMSGDFKKAIKLMSQILDIKGKVLPVTSDSVQLGAELENGRKIIGESKLSLLGHKHKIKRMFLKPAETKANKEALQAIDGAELIVIGPGSLYTSIIPNLLFSEISDKLAASPALKIFACNVATERGETESFSVKDHLETLIYHSNPGIIDICLVNDKILRRSKREGKLGEIRNITTLQKKILDYKIKKANIIDLENPLYHDSHKLARELMKIYWDIL